MGSRFGNAKPTKTARPSHFALWLTTPEGQEAFTKQMERMTMKGPAR